VCIFSVWADVGGEVRVVSCKDGTGVSKNKDCTKNTCHTLTLGLSWGMAVWWEERSTSAIFGPLRGGLSVEECLETHRFCSEAKFANSCGLYFDVWKRGGER